MSTLTDSELLERAKKLVTGIQNDFKSYGGNISDAGECLSIAGQVTNTAIRTYGEGRILVAEITRGYVMAISGFGDVRNRFNKQPEP